MITKFCKWAAAGLVLLAVSTNAATVDVFIATGQSNAYWPINPDHSGTYQFGHGVQDALTASGLFSNPTVVIDGQPGMEINHWYGDTGPNWLYEKQFFGTYQGSTAALEAKIDEIIANGNTPRFRGIFWFQGESDGEEEGQSNTSEAVYTTRWNGILDELASDLSALSISSNDFGFVMNTVGNAGTRINNTLAAITDTDSRGALFDTQVEPYRTNPADIHGYDHYAVGQANARLFIETFVRPIDIFIIAGQSNANGQGLVSTLTPQQKSAQDALFFCSWHLQAFNAESTQYHSGWLSQTVAGSTRADHLSSTFGNSTDFGPELGFVARANELSLTTNPMAIIKYAVDGSALTVNPNFSDWDLAATASNDGDCWRGLQAALAAAVAGLEATNYTPNFKGLIWWQGENGTSVAGLNSFIAAVRDLLADDYGLQTSSNFPVVITGNDFWGAGLEAGVADPDDHVGFIDSVEYGQVGGHGNVHIGSGDGAYSTDETGNGTNDMWDVGVAYADEMLALTGGSAPSPDATYDVTWDGGAGDGLWTSVSNWSGDVLPTYGDDVLIDGASVDYDVTAGAGSFLGDSLTLAGTATLTADTVIRFNGASVNVGSNATLAGTSFYDFNSASVTFDAGAGASLGSWEQKGSPTFTFNLDASGFTTLTPGTLYLSTGMSNVTYVVDMANYTGSVQNLTLIDFSSGSTLTDPQFQTATLIVTNAGSYAASLVWDDATDTIILDMGAIDYDKTWDDGGPDSNWATAANWNPDAVPGGGDTVLVGPGAVVTNAQSLFGSLYLGTGASVSFGTQFLNPGTEIISDGQLDFPGTARLNGSTVTLDGNGSLGAGVTWLDLLNGAINFVDGASFGNANMAIEHKGNNTIGFTLSETGFTTVQAGGLYAGNNGQFVAAWSNATYNIDISEYDHTNGRSIILADFASVFSGTFNPTVNIIPGDSGLGAELSLNAAEARLVLTIDPPGNDAPVAADQTVSVPTNGPVAFALLATDIEGSNLTYTVESQPSFGSLSGTAPDLTYTPTNALFSFDTFTFTAFDGQDVSNTGTVTMARIPYSDNELWATYHDAILNDPLNTEWLTNWVDNGISIWQIRYDLGELEGTRTNASPKIAAFYAHPVGGTDLPGLVQIHGGGQRGMWEVAKLWAEQGYAAISINWGALPLLDGQLNTDWDGLASGFTRDGVSNAIFHNWCDPDVYDDGVTLYDVPHPLNSSWIHNAYAGRRALTFLTDQSIVDTNKLGVVGWSMGGNTTSKVATDPRLTAVGPGVGGTGYLYEDWWGLPGSARSTNGVEAFDLHIRTVDSQSYWPDVTAPTLYLEAANDFNAPFDLVIKALSLQDTNVPQRLAVSPHFNHRNWPDAEASRVLWMKTHLTGTFDFPETSRAELDLTHPDGVPRFRVWPDTSTTNPIVSVDIYYGIERDSRLRFWRDTVAVETNGYWEAECPVYDVDEMMASMAIVKYDAGFEVPLFAGQSSVFSVASDVHLVYPPELENSGIRETAEKARLIDDFALGYKDWWYLNPDNTQHWQFWTRKLGDPSWRGPVGSELAFEVTTTATGNTLGIQLDTEIWNTTAATTFKATVAVSANGQNPVSLPVSAFTNGNGVALTTWDDVKHLGLLQGNAVDSGLPAWSGAAPTFSDLRWQGGVWTFTNGVTSTWLEQYGLGLNDLTVLSDTDRDGLANWQEGTAGTNPTNRASVLQLNGATALGGDDWVINWQAVEGKTYGVWFKTNLADALWAELGSGIPGVEPSCTHTVTVDSVTGFVRIAVE